MHWWVLMRNGDSHVSQSHGIDNHIWLLVLSSLSLASTSVSLVGSHWIYSRLFTQTKMSRLTTISELWTSHLKCEPLFLVTVTWQFYVNTHSGVNVSLLKSSKIVYKTCYKLQTWFKHGSGDTSGPGEGRGAEESSCLGPRNQKRVSSSQLTRTGNKAACPLFRKETKKKNALTMKDIRVRPYPGKTWPRTGF